MKPLNLPPYQIKIEQSGDKARVFDPARKKFVALTPEEWVRQNFMMYLVHEKDVPLSLLSVEGGMKIYKGLPRRSDIVVYDTGGHPLMLVECKSYNVRITPGAIDQTARYTSTIKARHLVVTNGLSHYSFHFADKEGKYLPSDRIPAFHEMTLKSP